MSAPLLHTQGLSKAYAGKMPVLSSLDLQMQAGSYTVLMGRSGAGKSTLLHLLAGLETASSGSLYYGERAMQRASEKEWALFRRRHIGMVFQDHNLIPYLSLLENVMLAGLLTESSPRALSQRALQLFAELEIEALARRLPTEVSGGERQRAAIARALINRPQILFADEPTGSLNSAAGLSVLTVLARLHRQGQSILMATHDLKAALEGSEVWFLQDGQRLQRWLPPQTADKDLQAEALYQWLQKQGW